MGLNFGTYLQTDETQPWDLTLGPDLGIPSTGPSLIPNQMNQAWTPPFGPKTILMDSIWGPSIGTKPLDPTFEPNLETKYWDPVVGLNLGT